MMITTINEFKKINEGGGAGISFETTATLNTSITITKNGDNYNFIFNKYNVNNESFSAKGYDDGMTDVDSKILEWKNINKVTIDQLLNLIIEDMPTVGVAENITDGMTVKEVFETQNINKLTIDLYANYKYNNMHFGGWVRGKLEHNDLVFSQSMNREGVDCDDFEYTFKWDNNSEGMSNYENDEFLSVIAPEAIGNEDFTYWYKDVFDYDLTNDAKLLAYQEVIEDDKYDNEIEEYMLNNEISGSIDTYKQSLVNEYQQLPDDLYDYIQSERDVETRTNDMHWEDVQANWGI